MGARSDRLKKGTTKLAKLGDEAQAAGLKAEDVLASLEDREARRAARSPQAMAGSG